MKVHATAWSDHCYAQACKEVSALKRSLDAGKGRHAGWAPFHKGVFNWMHDPLARVIEAEDGPADDLFGQLDALPEFEAACDVLQGFRNPAAVGLAAGRICDQIASSLPSREEREAREQREQSQSGDGRPSQTAIEELREMIEQSGAGQRIALRAAITRALKEAQEMEQNVDAMMTFGMSDQWGAAQAADPQKRTRLAKALGSSKTFRRIMRRAGRFKLAARAHKRSKMQRGVGGITDVERGAAIDKMLPSEQVLHMMPETEMLGLMRLATRTALQWRTEDKVDPSEGPCLVAIDQSGSMSGAKDEWAKALIIGIVERCRLEKRECIVYEWAVSVGRTFRFDKRGRLVSVEPHQQFDPALQEPWWYFIAQTADGSGTRIQNAVDHGIDLVTKGKDPTLKRADLILITDGSSDCSKLKASLDAARKIRPMRMFTFVIGDRAGDDLRAASEECVEFSSLTEEAVDSMANTAFDAIQS